MDLVQLRRRTWRSFQDEGGKTKISDDWEVRGWPTVYVIDAEGRIRSNNRENADATIEECLAELGHKVTIGGTH